jgi:RNase P/RNase MRP subunit p29
MKKGVREMSKIVKGKRVFEVTYEKSRNLFIVPDGTKNWEAELNGNSLEVGGKLLMNLTEDESQELKVMRYDIRNANKKEDEYSEFTTLSSVERQEKAEKMNNWLEKRQGYRISEND